MALKIGGIEFYTGPKEVGGPDDLLAAIVDFIDGAKTKLRIAVQELDSRPIAEAIVRARQRGVSVQLALEGDYLKTEKVVADPFSPGGQNEHNRFLQNAILRTAVDVKSDFNTAIFHQKFIIRDGSAVLGGSANFTETGVTRNLNHVVIFHSRKIANAYAKEYREIRQGRFGKRSVDRDEKPTETKLSEIPIKVLFAPDHAPEMEIMKQMLKAAKRIDFAIFTFSKSSGIDDTMIRLSTDGLPIRGALEGRAANQRWAATRPVKNAGAELFTVPSQGNLGKLHHKLMVIDEQVVIAGSFNYTGPANATNDENIVVIGDLESPPGQSRNDQRKLGRFARKEIDRIITEFGRAL